MATIRYFYIGANPVDIELSPQLASTLDESLDNLTVRTIANYVEQPYAPFQRFYIKDENYNTIQTFIISADNVELATQNPNRYIHNLSLVQLSEFLTKHEIRNTVFSNSLQSANYELYLGGRFYFDTYNQSMIRDNTTITVDLTKRKIKKLIFKPDFYACYQIAYNRTTNIGIILDFYPVNQDYDAKTWREVFKNVDDTQYLTTGRPSITFTIGGQTRLWVIDNFKLGEELSVPDSIMEWIYNGTGTLTIHLEFFHNLAGFVVTPLSDVNCPVYGKLSFDIEVNAIETSAYEAVDILLKQQMKETSDYNSTNDSANIKPLFLLPTQSHNPDLYNLLNDTNVPNLVFTQSTMYDALAEIFKLFDAIFTIDNDGYLDIEYFNEQAQEPIDEPEVAGKSQSLSEERFTNRLITYFQNTKITHRFPNSNDENATAYIASKTLGVPGQSDFVFKVPKPIDLIKRVKIYPFAKIKKFQTRVHSDIYGNYEVEYYFNRVDFNKTIDITPCIVESNMWSILPSTGTNNPYALELSKENTLTYERGENTIEIARYMNISDGTLLLNKQIAILTNVYEYALLRSLGISASSEFSKYDYTLSVDFHKVKMAVDYLALVDGKLVNESLDNKYNGETLINQSNGSIDINKLGLNMVGLGLKLGQPTLNMTQVFSSWDERVRKGQYFIDDNGDRWVANNCVYTVIKPDLVQTNIEFVKNFNGLAKRIELNSEKRLSNISNELTVKCEETYGEFVYYSSTKFDDNVEEKTVFNPLFLANQIAMTFDCLVPTFVATQEHPPLFAILVDTTINDIVNQNIDTSEYFLYRVYAYVEDYSISSGMMVINSSSDLSGTSLTIPFASGNADTIIQDVMEYKFKAVGNPSGAMTPGNPVTICLIVNENGEVKGGGITQYNGVDTDLDLYKINATYIENTNKVEYSIITSYDENMDIISHDETGEVKDVAIPLMVYGSGNSICFEMSFDSPISAGTQLLENSPLWTGGWFNNAVIYTDLDGYARAFTLKFVKMEEELTRYYPEMKKTTSTYLGYATFGTINQFKYYKKPNEIFALNYQLHFMPKDKTKDFLSNEFIKNNAFANGLNNKKFALMVSSDENIYSILDTKGEGNFYSIDACDVIMERYDSYDGVLRFAIRFTCNTLLVPWSDVKSWAITDWNENIYFASNVPPSSNDDNEENEYRIYFVTRHHRLT